MSLLVPAILYRASLLPPICGGKDGQKRWCDLEAGVFIVPVKLVTCAAAEKKDFTLIEEGVNHGSLYNSCTCCACISMY
jgi:hypothetical protein